MGPGYEPGILTQGTDENTPAHLFFALYTFGQDKKHWPMEATARQMQAE